MQVKISAQVIEVSLSTDMYDPSYHRGSSSLPSADHFATGPHLPPGTPDHPNPPPTLSPPHLAVAPLVRPGAPRPDVKPQGPRLQPVKSIRMGSAESTQASKVDIAPVLKSDISKIPKSDIHKVVKPKTCKPTPKSPKSPALDKAKFTPVCVPGIYGKKRFPCSRPKFIYAYGHDGDRWTHLPVDRRPTETKAEDYKPQLKSSKALVRVLLMGDPIHLGVCILKPKRGNGLGTTRELGKEKTGGSVVNGLASIFPAAASGEKEEAAESSSVAATLDGTVAQPTGGSGPSNEDSTSVVRDDAPCTGSVGPIPTLLQVYPAQQPRAPSPLLEDSLDSDTELIDLEAEPEIRQLCFPVPQMRRRASPPSPLDLRPHLNRALANFRAMYNVGPSLSSRMERSDSVESQGPVTPTEDGFVIIPIPGSECRHGEGSSIPMRNLCTRA